MITMDVFLSQRDILIYFVFMWYFDFHYLTLIKDIIDLSSGACRWLPGDPVMIAGFSSTDYPIPKKHALYPIRKWAISFSAYSSSF